MQAWLVTTFIGVLALNEKNKVIGFRSLGFTPQEVAQKIFHAKQVLIDEEKELIEELKSKGYGEFAFSQKKENFLVDASKDEFVRKNLFKLAKELKLFKSEHQLNSFIAQVNLELSKLQIRKAGRREDLILHATHALEELDRICNQLSERLRRFYSLHFPELCQVVSDNKKFAQLVLKFGSRHGFKATEYEELAEQSLGSELVQEDIKFLQEFAQKLLQLLELREKICSYTESLAKQLAPNLSELAGPLLAAKLIAKAGSLEKLAQLPASSLQLLGAEKSLFRFLRKRGKSPKHGLIFLHPYIQKAPLKLRGKIARALALKFSMASKFDLFSKRNHAEKLKKELSERIKEIFESR